MRHPRPYPLRLLLAAKPKLVTPLLQVVHRAITRFLLDQAGPKDEQADSGAVTLIQPSLWMKGSAANFNIHLHCLVLDGVCWCGAEGEPVFVKVPALRRPGRCRAPARGSQLQAA